jgi:DNA-binding NtrC family response regulator
LAKILVVDDEEHLRVALTDLLRLWGFEPVAAENYEEALDRLNDSDIEIILTDVKLPDGSGIELVKTVRDRGLTMPVIILTGHGSIEDAVEAIHRGAENYLTKPVEPPRLKLLIEQVLEKQEMQKEVKALRQQLRKAGALGALRGRSMPMQELYSLIERVAPTEASVFITGESGTGKSVIAKTIHDHSRRRAKPFVAVNCAAIAPTLIESELFGHERGAFTGATQQRRGYFEEAFGGTIFLDEITELPIELQGKLLRVLEENKIRRVGGNTELEINVRVISATNRDPKQGIADGKLREDLYYRINIFPIHAASLRERADDIPFLSQMFLEKLCEEEGRPMMTFEPRVLSLLKSYHWPGNVRELRNVVNRAMIITRGTKVVMDVVPEYLKKEVNVSELQPLEGTGLYGELDEDEEAEPGSGEEVLAGRNGSLAAVAAGSQSDSNMAEGSGSFEFMEGTDSRLETMERLYIKKLLDESGFDKPSVAKRLGISLKTLYNKINKYEL